MTISFIIFFYKLNVSKTNKKLLTVQRKSLNECKMMAFILNDKIEANIGLIPLYFGTFIPSSLQGSMKSQVQPLRIFKINLKRSLLS